MFSSKVYLINDMICDVGVVRVKYDTIEAAGE